MNTQFKKPLPLTNTATSRPQPNGAFNSDATSAMPCHAFGIFMACRGALRTLCSGAD